MGRMAVKDQDLILMAKVVKMAVKEMVLMAKVVKMAVKEAVGMAKVVKETDGMGKAATMVKVAIMGVKEMVGVAKVAIPTCNQLASICCHCRYLSISFVISKYLCRRENIMCHQPRRKPNRCVL